MALRPLKAKTRVESRWIHNRSSLSGQTDEGRIQRPFGNAALWLVETLGTEQYSEFKGPLMPLMLGKRAEVLVPYHFPDGTARSCFPSSSLFLPSAADPEMTVGGRFRMGEDWVPLIRCTRLRASGWPAGYALFAGVVFLVLAGVTLAPVIHHVLQRFHLEADEGRAEKY